MKFLGNLFCSWLGPPVPDSASRRLSPLSHWVNEYDAASSLESAARAQRICATNLALA